MAQVRRAGKRRAKTKGSAAQIIQMATDLGALSAKLINPARVETAQWVRWKCQIGCDGFNSSLMCPPHSPAPDETRKTLDEYRRAVLFEAPSGRSKEIAVKLERDLFLAGYYKAIGLGAGPCSLCNQCAFDAGCRHADEARPSMEACGIDVFATVRKHGFEINVVRNHKDSQHYFGLVLVD